jgi:archaellum component FlaF (FlaF/FlaG flagellin family)
MVATVLLIGFTIAVGAILSVWFTTFTRTQTAGITGSAACHGGNVRVYSNVSSTASNAVRVFITNLRSDMSLNINGIAVACESSTQSASGSPLKSVGPAGTESYDVSGLSGCTISNTAITVSGNCSTGGSFTASCPAGACGM